MTETLKSLLRQAWYYFPFDCWDGIYKDGVITLDQVFKSDSVVDSVRIEDLRIENKTDPKNNKITLVISSKEDREVKVELTSQASEDNLAIGDSKTVMLKKDKETSVELSFGGFANTRYYITVFIDNTRISLTIEP